MKVCFVAHGVYPIISNSCPIERIGGAELQQVQVGRGLRQRNIDVSYITYDHGQPDGEIIDGLTIHKSFRESEGLPGIRFFYPRLFKIWRALQRADADVYYCRAAGFMPGVLALFCRLHRKKFIYAGAHDSDFMPDRLLISNQRDRFLYRFGLRHADAIFVQSRQQQQLLKDNFGLESMVIRNLLGGEDMEEPVPERGVILWVSTIKTWKRPFQFIQLARLFPDEHFVMIGPDDGSDMEIYQAVTEQCRQLANIDFLGFQPLEQTEQYFTRCKVFVNTSEQEGFPNTFLQSWRRGIPVISYVDPDNVIRENSLGLVVTSEDALREALRSFLEGPRPDPEGIRQYFSDNHSAGVFEQYRTILESLTHVA
jgi:glycosyltransferase involved in cell wall biosynthesis